MGRRKSDVAQTEPEQVAPAGEAPAQPDDAPAQGAGDAPAAEAGDEPAAPDDHELAPTEQDAPAAEDDEAAGTDEGEPEATGADGEAPDRPVDPEQRWAAFAPQPEARPSRWRRAGRAVGRVLGHEWTIATVASLLLAALMTWPALRHPRYTLPQDLGDPTLVSWLLSWPGHALTTDPGQLWHANAFFPERWSFAFTDSLLGYAPAGLLGDGPLDAVLRYNILFVLAHALAFLGAYALVRQLGAGPTGAVLAALAFAYAPWRLTQAGHLHVLSTGGVALALAMLARGHGWSLRRVEPADRHAPADQPPEPRGGFRPARVRVGWIIAGWLVAAWQITLGFGIGLVFGYVLAGIALLVSAAWVLRRIGPRRWRPGTERRVSRRIVAANLLGGVLFAVVTVLMALPYLTVQRLHPHAERTFGEVSLFSPPLRGFLTAPAESWLWGARHEGARAALSWAPEMALLPGFTLLAVAVAGLFVSIWTRRVRWWLASGVVVTTVLALGTTVAGGAAYRLLYTVLPGWSAIRTPGRLVIWITLLLGILAAGAVGAFIVRARELAAEQGWSSRPGPWLRAAALLPVLLVLVEGISTTPHPVVPPPPAALSTVEGPVLVLPSDPLIDMQVMLWSTDGFVPIVNGNAGFIPESLARTREVTQAFPDVASVEYLRGLGVHTVVLLGDRVTGTPWEGAVFAGIDGLGITRQQIQNAVVFDLNP